MITKQPPVRINFATYNIRNTMDRYPERKEILKQTIQNVNADIMGLQEVAFGNGGQLDYLTEDEYGNDMYKQYNAKMQVNWQDTIDNEQLKKECNLNGNSFILSNNFISNCQILSEKILHLSLVRVAQLLKLQLSNNKQLYIVNTHLHHLIPDTQIRHNQCEQILQWLKIHIPDFNTANIIFSGDFNATPNEECYRLLDQNFKSLHVSIHGKEPEFTFPTGLQAPNMDTDPQNCLDYIWYRGDDINPISCNIFGNQCLDSDNTIYPSDHIGIQTYIEVK